ncbi:hypothetical protein [Rhodanobacter sp. C05]|uniref:LptM family lipoprotein n=1 Tax=Rhodanobacter sp. C05 TaxID=1945855 RepID=UPI00098717F3|nr:hypothetical protein [Rhodanobacter sp. C05]OOG40832.1 hypothetical protein B0E51_09485 [Rhodanobacter sp. C05]
MKRLFASLALVVAAVTLSGCYYDPGYVRSTGYGGAYYSQVAPVYGDGYYVAPGYYDYYGYYGCCYAPGVGLWYGGGAYYRGGYGYRGYRGPGGHWQGAHGSVQHGHVGSSGYNHHH